MEWFKCIDKFNNEKENACDADGSVFIDIETWKKKEKLEDHFNAAYKDYQIGKRKGFMKHINRFTEEADDLLMQIGNETFYGASDDYKKDTIRSLADLWITACKVYFRNKEGKAVYTRAAKDKNENGQSINAVIPFGPWILWNEDDWAKVVYKYGKWKRLQKRNKDAQVKSTCIQKFTKTQCTSRECWIILQHIYLENACNIKGLCISISLI